MVKTYAIRGVEYEEDEVFEEIEKLIQRHMIMVDKQNFMILDALEEPLKLLGGDEFWSAQLKRFIEVPGRDEYSMSEYYNLLVPLETGFEEKGLEYIIELVCSDILKEKREETQKVIADLQEKPSVMTLKHAALQISSNNSLKKMLKFLEEKNKEYKKAYQKDQDGSLDIN